MLKRIAMSDLRIGMYIQEFCGSWMDHPFWKAKFLLETDKDLQRIQTCGLSELWIDASKGLDVEAGRASVTPAEVEVEVQERLMAAALPTGAICSLEDELNRAAKLCNRSKQAVMDMFGDARMG